MQTKTLQKNNRGFAFLETVTLLIVVSVIAGAGVYVYNHRNDSDSVADTSVSAPVGSTARTLELNDSEINQESEISSSYDSQESAAATSDNTAMANLEGASDGSEL
ncbi:hypothetical protein KDA23_05765 [Candidatus Saccharibacteria bacterium]|nr:hypothetical protein [Candidatus Saccharibacteria bacterium]